MSPDSYDVVWWEWKTTLRPRPAGNRRGSFIPFIRLVLLSRYSRPRSRVRPLMTTDDLLSPLMTSDHARSSPSSGTRHARSGTFRRSCPTNTCSSKTTPSLTLWRRSVTVHPWPRCLLPRRSRSWRKDTFIRRRAPRSHSVRELIAIGLPSDCLRIAAEGLRADDPPQAPTERQISTRARSRSSTPRIQSPTGCARSQTHRALCP